MIIAISQLNYKLRNHNWLFNVASYCKKKADE